MLEAIRYFISLSLVFLIVGCSAQKSQSPEKIAPSVDNSLPIAESAEAATKQIAEIKEQVNQDVQYALRADDVSTLVSEGLVEESEIKGWVK